MMAQPQRQNASVIEGAMYAAVWLLTLPALSAAVLTRRNFGVRAIMPWKFAVMVLAMWLFHDATRGQNSARVLFFDGSLAWQFCQLSLVAAAVHFVRAVWLQRTPLAPHSYFLGEPWLTRLGIGFRLACVLDITLILASGSFIRRYDAALGAWLFWGAVGLLTIMVLGLRQQFQDTTDMRDGALYAAHIQYGNAPRRTWFGAAGRDEEISTGASGPDGINASSGAHTKSQGSRAWFDAEEDEIGTGANGGEGR